MDKNGKGNKKTEKMKKSKAQRDLKQKLDKLNPLIGRFNALTGQEEGKSTETISKKKSPTKLINEIVSILKKEPEKDENVRKLLFYIFEKDARIDFLSLCRALTSSITL